MNLIVLKIDKIDLPFIFKCIPTRSLNGNRYINQRQIINAAQFSSYFC